MAASRSIDWWRLSRVGFTKLDDNLDGSSIFREPDDVFKVWMLILSKTRSDGLAPISADYISSITRKGDDEVERCLHVLMSPDPRSRSQNDEGRRISRVDGGFFVINYEKYRQRADAEGVREYERDRKRLYRAQERTECPVGVPDISGPSASASASASPSASEEGKTEPQAETAIPPEQRAEDATKTEIHRLQLELGSRVARLAEHPNSRLMVTSWSRKVTAYKCRPKGGAERPVRGVPDYRTIFSIDRLEKSIEDADWWAAQMDAGRIVAEEKPRA